MINPYDEQDYREGNDPVPGMMVAGVVFFLVLMFVNVVGVRAAYVTLFAVVVLGISGFAFYSWWNEPFRVAKREVRELHRYGRRQLRRIERGRY